MSGIPDISLKEEIQFLKYYVIPSFSVELGFTTSNERTEWMKTTAIDDKWLQNKVTLLIRSFINITTLEKAEAEVDKKKQELQSATGENYCVDVMSLNL